MTKGRLLILTRVVGWVLFSAAAVAFVTLTGILALSAVAALQGGTSSDPDDGSHVTITLTQGRFAFAAGALAGALLGIFLSRTSNSTTRLTVPTVWKDRIMLLSALVVSIPLFLLRENPGS